MKYALSCGSGSSLRLSGKIAASPMSPVPDVPVTLSGKNSTRMAQTRMGTPAGHTESLHKASALTCNDAATPQYAASPHSKEMRVARRSFLLTKSRRILEIYGQGVAHCVGQRVILTGSEITEVESVGTVLQRYSECVREYLAEVIIPISGAKTYES